jgi:hypothetical protein
MSGVVLSIFRYCTKITTDAGINQQHAAGIANFPFPAAVFYYQKYWTSGVMPTAS